MSRAQTLTQQQIEEEERRKKEIGNFKPTIKPQNQMEKFKNIPLAIREIALKSGLENNHKIIVRTTINIMIDRLKKQTGEDKLTINGDTYYFGNMKYTKSEFFEYFQATYKKEIQREINKYTRFIDITKEQNKNKKNIEKKQNNIKKIEKKQDVIKNELALIKQKQEKLNSLRHANLLRTAKIINTQAEVNIKSKDVSNSASFQSNFLKRGLNSSLRDIDQLNKNNQRDITTAKKVIDGIGKDSARAQEAYFKLQQKNIKSLQDRLEAEKALEIAKAAQKALEDLGKITRAITTGTITAYAGLTAAYNANTQAFAAGLQNLSDTLVAELAKIKGSLGTMGANVSGVGTALQGTAQALLDLQRGIEDAKRIAAQNGFDWSKLNLDQNAFEIEAARLKWEEDMKLWDKDIPPPDVVDTLNGLRCESFFGWAWKDDEPFVNGYTTLNGNKVQVVYQPNPPQDPPMGMWRCIIGTQYIRDFKEIEAIGKALKANNNNPIIRSHYLTNTYSCDANTCYYWGTHRETAQSMNILFKRKGKNQIDYKRVKMFSLNDSYITN